MAAFAVVVLFAVMLRLWVWLLALQQIGLITWDDLPDVAEPLPEPVPSI